MGNELTSASKSKWKDQGPASASSLQVLLRSLRSWVRLPSQRRKDPWHRLSARPMTPGPPSARIPVIRCLLRPARFFLEPPLHIHFHALPSRNLTQHYHFRPLTSRRRPQLSAVILSESHHIRSLTPSPRTGRFVASLPAALIIASSPIHHPPEPQKLTAHCLLSRPPTPAKVASSQPLLASSGALQNITALLPTTLQVYLDKSIASLAKAIANYSGYISDTTGIDPNLILYSTIGCILLAVPFTMSRYGWSTNREQISPYSSTLSGVPDVTDEDFSYITTEDLQSTSLGSSVPTRSYAHNPRSRGSVPDDDILLIKNKGITYPAHFPAYAIGDGKLRVRDVRDRVSVLLELSERRGRRVKLLYKGRQLKEPAAPVRDYGVKNNSEVMVVLPEGEVDAESSDDSDEEMVVVGGDGGSAVGSNGGTDDGKKRRGKKKGRKSKKRSSNTSPRDSASNLGVPGQERQSSPSPSKANGPHAKLDAIAAKFEADLRQPCEDYIASPPTDPKKREEEHRKLSETTMQHVLLKLDEVETEGDQDARMKRKALVQTVQDVLKRLDARLKA
ncbi:BAG domain-containing protein [Colletotrichum nymphaeae SA-01]|uniref:BAG domain-containing protein n=1 Tax=Colletotrichum nymphaeae SA-01 TaxID=1460502 RepID=A0A135RQ26_9PEZI|nr:BAG domain-containing protein [Colletotrichum nymphaeae SA-01]